MYSIQWNELDYGEANGTPNGYNKMATSTVLDILRDNKPLEELIKYSHLPEAKILELAKQLHK